MIFRMKTAVQDWNKRATHSHRRSWVVMLTLGIATSLVFPKNRRRKSNSKITPKVGWITFSKTTRNGLKTFRNAFCTNLKNWSSGRISSAIFSFVDGAQAMHLLTYFLTTCAVVYLVLAQWMVLKLCIDRTNRVILQIFGRQK